MDLNSGNKIFIELGSDVEYPLFLCYNTPNYYKKRQQWQENRELN